MAMQNVPEITVILKLSVCSNRRKKGKVQVLMTGVYEE